jgi:hypothetical protein
MCTCMYPHVGLELGDVIEALATDAADVVPYPFVLLHVLA